MKTVLIDLFTSKKFLAALSAVAIYIAGRFGFDLDPAALDRIFAAFLVYIGAQGVADAGKSAEMIRATRFASFGAPPAGLETGAAVLSGRDAELDAKLEAKYVAKYGSAAPMLVVLLLAIGGAGLTGACTKQQVASGVRAGGSCQAPSVVAAVGELLGWATERVAAAIAGGQVDGAKLRAAMANVLDTSPRCAIEAAVAAAARPPESARSLAAPVDGNALLAEYARAKAELGWSVR